MSEIKIPLVRRLANLVASIRFCESEEANESQRSFRDAHEATLRRLVGNHMPSGSGWDHGTTLDLSRSTPMRLVFTGAYHHMNDGGMYDGWTDHDVVVTPSFDGPALRITGRDRNQIKDVLHAWFATALETPVSYTE